MMKLFFLSSFLMAGVFQSCAQKPCPVKTGYAYYNVSMPGMQMADENGNPVPVKPYITRFIYVEYKDSAPPEILTVLYDSSALLFTVALLKEKTVAIGDKDLNPGKTITVKKGYSFLKIDLQAANGKTMPGPDCKNITIKSKVAGKINSLQIKNEQEFATHPHY
jgi:hypothetical protein